MDLTSTGAISGSTAISVPIINCGASKSGSSFVCGPTGTAVVVEPDGTVRVDWKRVDALLADPHADPAAHSVAQMLDAVRKGTVKPMAANNCAEWTDATHTAIKPDAQPCVELKP